MKSMKIALIALLALGACKKASEPAMVDHGGSGSAAGSAGPSDADKLAKGMADAQAEAAKEAARWTPEVTAAAVAVRDQPVTDTKTMLTAILASPHREPGNRDRDAARHPVETLDFFGLQPTQTVIELGAGGGWYTELLAPFLYGHGTYVVAGPDATAPAGKMSTVSGHALDLFLAKSPAIFGKVKRVGITTPDALVLGPAGSADLVLAFREMHNWQRRGELAQYLAAIHAVLKPGGTFGLVAHRAVAGTKGDATAETGYLAEAWVIEQVTAAGFELAGKSEVNANAKDTKDYPKGGLDPAADLSRGRQGQGEVRRDRRERSHDAQVHEEVTRRRGAHRVRSPAEARAGLVLASVFKTDGAPRERRHGGFDSHALPYSFS